MRQVRGVTGLCVLIAMTLTAAGCATPLGDDRMPGRNVSYVRGNTQGDVQASPEQVVETAGSVMAGMQMDVGEPQREEGGVYALLGRTTTGRQVRILALPREEAGVTQLRVRIGSFGDQRLSNELYRRIANRLE